ncbi:MAG: glycosyltransferase [Hyphomicrobiales bacterium]|nr:glycosyltransferase [Hyphomicrobiales bacterium]
MRGDPKWNFNAEGVQGQSPNMSERHNQRNYAHTQKSPRRVSPPDHTPSSQAAAPGQLQQSRHPASRHLPVQRPAPKRIAFVGPSFASLAVNMGGLIYDIACAGHRTACFAPDIDDKTACDALTRRRAALRELPAFRQGFSPIADQRSIWRLVSDFRKMQPDVVAGLSPKAALLVAIAGRIARVPHVVSMIGELGRGFDDGPEGGSFLSRIRQRNVLNLAFKFSNTAVFYNRENHKLLQAYNLLSRDIRQFPMNSTGIDLRYFPPAPLPALENGIMFLFAGPLDRRLGIAEFCRAARILQNRPGHYRCLVVGPEVEGPNGFPLALLQRQRDIVQYLGPQTDIRPFLARSHVFVLPAKGDGIPQALIEAIAMGRPVITTTARGCIPAVREGANGLLVAPNDAQALAGAMAQLLMRPDLLPSMARASRDLAKSQFDIRRINTLLFGALDI